MTRFDVLVVDNHDVVRAGLLLLPMTHGDVVRTVLAHERPSDIDLSTGPPDVVVLDLWLGRDSQKSISWIPVFKGWGAKVLIYTSTEVPHQLREALIEGADGVCLKNDGISALVGAMTQLGAGAPVFSSALARAATDDKALRARLTPTEIEVLGALAMGFEPKEIAQRTHTSVSTINTHVENIRAKYATPGERMTRARVLYEAQRDGYWTPNEDPGIT